MSGKRIQSAIGVSQWIGCMTALRTSSDQFVIEVGAIGQDHVSNLRRLFVPAKPWQKIRQAFDGR